MQGATSRAWVGLLGAVLIGAGCASSPMLRIEGGYRHELHGYAIARPDGAGEAWQRVTAEGAALAFRRPGPESMGLESRCGRPVAEPVFAARDLLIGMRERTLVAAGPTQVDGRDAWTQTLDTVQAGVSVRMKTVTLVAAGCSFDWVLTTPGSFEQAEQSFDAWWGSFRLDPRYDEGPDEGPDAASDEDRGA
jgi:hypothetical protein